MHELGLVRRRHHNKVRQAAEIGQIKRAGMCRAIGADKSGAVHRKAHRQLLDRHVVDHLVVGALQEGRIDHGKRLQPFCRKTSRKRHRMLFGDANVKGAVREGVAECIKPGARWHRGRDGDDARIGFGFRDQRVSENFRVGRRSCLALRLCTGGHVELGNRMALVGRPFGWRVATALLGHDMEQHGAALGILADRFHRRDQSIHVMAVDRADVAHAELFKQRVLARGRRRQMIEMRVQCTSRGRDGHVVVVEHNQQAALESTGHC